ncbi:serine/threonine dehydratase [Streptomyces collinus]|uniref:serine/threonine dehydratase n=1 Tax=Streptomyces collinus TaxID=42684 RepID=UPI003429A2E8
MERRDVLEAATRIRSYVRRTPVIGVDFPDLLSLHLKLETQQITGSFKPRGIFNKMLMASETGALGPAGAVIASGGNAGLAAAHAARILGVPVRVFLPNSVSPIKARTLQQLGAHVCIGGDFYPDALAASLAHAKTSGALFLHAFDQDEVAAGHGTLGLELFEQLPQVDTVLVAVGGGGLLSGLIAGIPGHVHVVAVESDGCPSLHQALQADGPVDSPVGGIAADALGANRVSRLAYTQAVAGRAASVLVTDEAIAMARQALWRTARLAVEWGSAAPMAALFSGAYEPRPDECVAVVLCGANTDPSDLEADRERTGQPMSFAT